MTSIIFLLFGIFQPMINTNARMQTEMGHTWNEAMQIVQLYNVPVEINGLEISPYFVYALHDEALDMISESMSFRMGSKPMRFSKLLISKPVITKEMSIEHSRQLPELTVFYTGSSWRDVEGNQISAHEAKAILGDIGWTKGRTKHLNDTDWDDGGVYVDGCIEVIHE